jgi:hypothetical protein
VFLWTIKGEESGRSGVVSITTSTCLKDGPAKIAGAAWTGAPKKDSRVENPQPAGLKTALPFFPTPRIERVSPEKDRRTGFALTKEAPWPMK